MYIHVSCTCIFLVACVEVEACIVGPEELRPQYKNTVFGFVSAFMTAYVQVSTSTPIHPVHVFKVCGVTYCTFLF